MFYKNKKIFLPLVTVALVLLVSGVVYASSQTRLFISNQEVINDVPPQIINGRAMVPVRVVSEYLGSTVNWDANNNAVYIQPNNETQNATTSNTSSTNINPTVTLTKEQRAEQLKDILTLSIESIYYTLYPENLGDSELGYANCYANLHRDYTKFNILFSEEYLNNEYVTPGLEEIDRAYINALKALDYPGTPYASGDFYEWTSNMENTLKIVLDKFNYYVSIDGKYY